MPSPPASPTQTPSKPVHRPGAGGDGSHGNCHGTSRLHYPGIYCRCLQKGAQQRHSHGTRRGWPPVAHGGAFVRGELDSSRTKFTAYKPLRVVSALLGLSVSFELFRQSGNLHD